MYLQAGVWMHSCGVSVMKPNSSPEKVRCSLYRRSKQRGFALVISLSLMVLLTVLAIGLLTLSTVSLRASGQSEAMEVAKSNARMALSLAIGQAPGLR